MYVSIGGIEQWIQIGGSEAADHPVLLYLHGGPGGTSVPAAAAWKPWEEHFAVVHWDQRGANRTFAKNGAAGCGPLTVDRMVRDGIEVAEFLIAHLQRPKILLVGHSWGSALGIHMLKRRPELFAGFVGTGQLVNMKKNEEYNYRWQLEEAQRRGDREALEALTRIGPPPFSGPRALKIMREYADRFAEGDGDSVQPRPTPLSPDFKPDEVPKMMQGAEYTRQQLHAELMEVDLPALGLDFSVPMFFFQGACDRYTPTEPVEDYYARIKAPHKELVRFEGCHHFVVLNRPDLFLRELLARVRPLV
jgi:pimeloyl-ACP methyl ester carboxylesterase